MQSLDESAILRIEALAQAASDLLFTQNVVSVPQGSELESLERFQLSPNRQRAHITSRRIADFLAYSERHRSGDSAFFIDPDNLTVHALYDYLNGWSDHTASLVLAKTPEYASIAEHKGNWTQQNLLEWLEDYAGDGIITAHRDDGTGISMAVAIQAIQTVKVKGIVEVSNTERQLSSTKSVLDDIAITSADGRELPCFILHCPLYEDTASRHVALKLTKRQVGEGDKATTQIALRIIAHESHKKAVSDELEIRIGALKEAAVYVGNVSIQQHK